MLCLLNNISRFITVNVKINGLTRWTENDLKWKLFFPLRKEISWQCAIVFVFPFSCVFFKSLAWEPRITEIFLNIVNFEKRISPVQNIHCEWQVCFHSAFLLRLSIQCGLKKFHSPYPMQFHLRIIFVNGPPLW